MIIDSSGNLFGTTSSGGIGNDGTVFEVAAGSGAITALASFNGTNGLTPDGGLVEDSSGNLFGTTFNGGSSSDGAVFEVAAGSHAITTLASFNGTNGANPVGSLVEDSSGNLFGTTQGGGAYGDGTVFKVAAGSGSITTLASFDYTNGANPVGGLVEDSSGDLFGTAASGGSGSDGTVFEIAAGSGAVATLASFNGGNGFRPEGGLVEDGSGDLFGTTLGGGSSGDGTVFEIAAGSGVVTTLTSFNGANGAEPVSGLVKDGSGNFFGTTVLGGPSNAGTVFEIKVAGRQLTKAGNSVLVLTGNNTYDGNTVLSAGTLEIGSNTALGNPATSDLVFNGGNLTSNSAAAQTVVNPYVINACTALGNAANVASWATGTTPTIASAWSTPAA